MDQYWRHLTRTYLPEADSTLILGDATATLEYRTKVPKPFQVGRGNKLEALRFFLVRLPRLRPSRRP